MNNYSHLSDDLDENWTKKKNKREKQKLCKRKPRNPFEREYNTITVWVRRTHTQTGKISTNLCTETERKKKQHNERKANEKRNTVANTKKKGDCSRMLISCGKFKTKILWFILAGTQVHDSTKFISFIFCINQIPNFHCSKTKANAEGVQQQQNNNNKKNTQRWKMEKS